MSDVTNDIEYYKRYYQDVNDYAGELWKHSSRFLVFTEWLRSYLKPGAKVLDIGCGDAIFAELMPEFEWYGVDINVERASRVIKPKTKIIADGVEYSDPEQLRGKSFNSVLIDEEQYPRLVTHDLMKPPYPWPEKYFDAIVCSEVLEHLWDLRIVHKEARRLLKREGVYIISTPNFNWLQNIIEHHQRILTDFRKSWTVEHIRHYTFETHQKFLNEVGLVVDKHTGSCGHFDPVTANICINIQKRLREQGVETNLEQLHKFAGEATPHLSHTTIISARKA